MQAEFPAIELSVSEFVALLNQTLEYAYPSVTITGELANLRVSRNRWVYFDLKDDSATVKFFGTVYQLPGPLEDGMLLKVRGQPRLHQLYGFSVNVLNIQPAGEGAIRRAADLLKAKLAKEGLFEESRKRNLPYPPARIGLITSKQSAAYGDFIKILKARWRGINIELIDVQVQGMTAPAQIKMALAQFNAQSDPPEVLIMIRGGGSSEDLAAFNTEQVTRAVAASRAPTLVAIGHEVDLSLAELAADRRASTPSNAAELLVPDRFEILAGLSAIANQLQLDYQRTVQTAYTFTAQQTAMLQQRLGQVLTRAFDTVNNQAQLLAILNPQAILRRGYAIVRRRGQSVRSVYSLGAGDIVDVQVNNGSFAATVGKVSKAKSGKSNL